MIRFKWYDFLRISHQEAHDYWWKCCLVSPLYSYYFPLLVNTQYVGGYSENMKICWFSLSFPPGFRIHLMMFPQTHLSYNSCNSVTLSVFNHGHSLFRIIFPLSLISLSYINTDSWILFYSVDHSSLLYLFWYLSYNSFGQWKALLADSCGHAPILFSEHSLFLA